jgi:hypothetical protein
MPLGLKVLGNKKKMYIIKIIIIGCEKTNDEFSEKSKKSNDESSEESSECDCKYWRS